MLTKVDKGQSIGGHVKDLSKVVIKAIVTWLVTTLSLFLMFKDQVVNFYLNPIKDSVEGLNFLKPLDALMFYMKMFAISGLVLCLPVVIILIWNYIKPALRNNESKFIGYYLSVTMFLVSFAIVYGYQLLVPVSLRFLVGIEVTGVNFNLDAYAYLGFFTTLFFVLVLVFQMPILLFGLVRSGIIPARLFRENRKLIFLADVILMTLVSPTSDVFSLALFVVPTYGLMELAVWLACIGREDVDEDPSGIGSSVDALLGKTPKVNQLEGGNIVGGSRSLSAMDALQDFRDPDNAPMNKK